MNVYIPCRALKDTDNEKKIRKILEKVPDSDIRVDGEYSLDDAAKEIRALGEDEIASLISMG